jgi:predicted ATPase/class 3 adenylate cyclase
LGVAAHMAELPSGTVTFLFSDVEGSTRLLMRLGGRYAEVLGEHQRLLRAAFGEHGGREVHTEGDAFFVAFARASDAIAAAASAQRSLASHRWPEGVDVRVRMGVHTGEAEVRQDDYVGLDVHRAARICAAGHGGQVLISSSTRELVADELPADVALKDLGEHRLKDLDRPEHLFQLVVGDLPSDFPPLAAVSPVPAAANGLPPSPNRTIGREADVRAIADRLRVDGVRLLTLTGPGGVGKTRLALEAARALQTDFADGAYFVALDPLRRAEDVPSAVVRSLGVRPLSGETAERGLVRFLSSKRVLLVLDNVEHLPGAARFMSELLAACRSLTVLATSREPLALAGEERYPVAPLALPVDDGDLDALRRVAAIALFAERARAHDPGFRVTSSNALALVEICRRLDGLPLAIELAAARCTVLAPAEIAQRLDAALGALGRGPRDAPARQRTLRATIEWSFDLLADAERDAFSACAVFAGGCTVRAGEEVTEASLDTLDSLVMRSLLVRRGHRLVMLETMRQYAGERLQERTDAAAVHRRHALHYLELAEGAEAELVGADRARWLAALDAEDDNLRAALRWALDRGERELALRLAAVAAVDSFWPAKGMSVQGLSDIDAALRLAGPGAPAAQRAKALLACALLSMADNFDQGRRAAQDAHRLFAALNDAHGSASALIALARIELNADHVKACAIHASAALELARATRDDFLIAEALAYLAGTMPLSQGRRLVDEASARYRSIGNLHGLSAMLSRVSYVAMAEGDYEAACALLERATDLAEVLGEPFSLAVIRGNQGLAALFTGDTATAATAFTEELEISREQVVPSLAAEGIGGLGGVATLRGETDRAARLCGAFLEHTRSMQALDRRLYEEIFAPARAEAGIEGWDRRCEEGRRMTLDEAIAYALTDDTLRTLAGG